MIGRVGKYLTVNSSSKYLGPLKTNTELTDNAKSKHRDNSTMKLEQKRFTIQDLSDDLCVQQSIDTEIGLLDLNKLFNVDAELNNSNTVFAVKKGLKRAQTERSNTASDKSDVNPHDSDSQTDSFEFTEPTMNAPDIENDEDFGPMYKYLAYNQLTGDKQIDYKTMLLREDFLIQNERLYKITGTRAKKLKHVSPTIERLAIPKAFRLSVLEKAHSLNHYAGMKLYNTLYQYVYWPEMYSSCFEMPKNCQICLEVRPNRNKQIPNLHPYIILDACGESIGFDYKDLCRTTKHGFKAVAVFIDHFSGYVMFELTRDVSAHSLGQAFIKRVLPIFAIPARICSDKGAANTSKLWKYICSMLNIKDLMAASLNPRSAGHTERAVKSLCDALAVLAPNDVEIEKYLPLAEMNVNCTTNSATGLSPFQLVRGQLPNLALNPQPSASPIVNADERAYY